MQEINKFQRLDLIVKEIKLSGKVDMKSLSKLFEVSIDTIRRDIKELDEQGVIQATRGGAASKSPVPVNFRDRLTFDTLEKKKVALKAVSLIEDGHVIMMSGGTSIVALASVIPINANITVVTNSFPVVEQLAGHENVEILFAGGRFSRSDYGTIGLESANFFSRIRADIFFFAPFSIHPELGITSNRFEHASMERSMIGSSKKVIALVTSSKIDTAENFHVCELTAVHTLITELDFDDAKLKAYKNTAIDIL